VWDTGSWLITESVLLILSSCRSSHQSKISGKSFRSAADCCIATRSGSRHLFGTLAEALPAARRSLNRVAEEFLFLGE
jgi:hypothetical protein